jgi:hypothetical protein
MAAWRAQQHKNSIAGRCRHELVAALKRQAGFINALGRFLIVRQAASRARIASCSAAHPRSIRSAYRASCAASISWQPRRRRNFKAQPVPFHADAVQRLAFRIGRVQNVLCPGARRAEAPGNGLTVRLQWIALDCGPTGSPASVVPARLSFGMRHMQRRPPVRRPGDHGRLTWLSSCAAS